MWNQQKARQRINQIVKKNPSISIGELVYKFYNKKISKSEINAKLHQISQTEKFDQQNQEQKMGGISAINLYVEKTIDIVKAFGPIIKEIIYSQRIRQQSLEKTHTNTNLLQKKQQAKQMVNSADQNLMNQINLKGSKLTKENDRQQFEMIFDNQTQSKSITLNQSQKIKNLARAVPERNQFQQNLQNQFTNNPEKRSYQQIRQLQLNQNNLQDNLENDPQLELVFNQFYMNSPQDQNDSQFQQTKNQSDLNSRQSRGLQGPQQYQANQRSHMFHQKKYSKLKDKLNRYLIVAYHQYVFEALSNQNIFDKKQIFSKPLMDLTLFLKFYKDFDLKQFLKVNIISKVFKKEAVNHLWVDAEKFMEVCYYLAAMKSAENFKEITIIVKEQELTQRLNKLIKVFDKEKIKKILQIRNNEERKKILDHYRNRETKQSVQKNYENKGEVVDKFLERNFDLQLPKWYDKKEIDPSKLVKSRLEKVSKPRQNHQKKRDQNVISSNIQKLKSKSEKSIKILKGLLQQNFDIELLGQNTKHKSVTSAYKQIEQFVIKHSKIMKQENKALIKQLKINEDEPFLNVYFSREFKAQNIKFSHQKNNVIMNNKNSKDKKDQNLHHLPLFKKNTPLKMLSQQQKINIMRKIRPKNELKDQKMFEQFRKNSSISEPTNLVGQLVQPKRVYSLKKIMEKQNNQKITKSSSKLKIPQQNLKKIVEQQVRQNKDQSELINKKLYKFLLKNQEFQEIRQRNKQKKNSNYSSIPTSQAQKSEQNNLIKNYRKQIQELFKGFRKREKEEEKISIYQHQKINGYEKVSKGKFVLNQK